MSSKERDALKKAKRTLRRLQKYLYLPPSACFVVEVVILNIDTALAEPPRNCDVGTVDEQEARYRATGELYHTLTLRNALTWAQMPSETEEGGAK